MPASSAIRTIELRGPSARAEAVALFRALTAVAFAALFLIGRSWPDDGVQPGASPSALEAPAYQVLFRDLSPAEQRSFRQLQEGLTEAENARPGLPDWPTPEALAAQGVPPFAPDPLAPGWRWSLRRQGSNVTYLGTPPAGGPAYLLLLQEPPPGTPGDPPDTPPDETHHRLANGTILHVSIWEQPAGRVAADPAVLDRPYLGGWRQILVTPPVLTPPSGAPGR